MPAFFKYTFAGAMLAVASTVSISGASAAAIAWSGPTSVVSADAALGQAGTIMGAEAWGGGNTTVTLSNGQQVSFQQGALNGSNSFATTGNAQGVTGGDTAQYHGTSNANFNKVLGDFQYDGNQTLTFNNLVIGNTYTIQLFALDDRWCCGGAAQYFSDSATRGTGDISQSFLLSANDFVLGTFTASATTQTVYAYNATGQNGGTGQPETNLNAAVLYAVPEPASLALMGAGLVGLAFMGRRRAA